MNIISDGRNIRKVTGNNEFCFSNVCDVRKRDHVMKKLMFKESAIS